MAMYSISGFWMISKLGRNPPSTATTSGCENKISAKKHPPIVTMSVITNASMYRNPLFCRYMTARTSSAVRQTPQMSG